MADRPSQTHDEPRTETERAERHGPVGHHAHSTEGATRSTAVTAAAILGIVGIVAGIIEGFWFIALPAGAIALAMAEPVRRSDAGAEGHRTARIAVVLAAVALVLAVVNFIVTFGGFDFFTVSPDTLLGS